MPWPWSRRARATSASSIPADWIERELWAEWEAPRNYVAGEQSYLVTLSELAGPTCESGYCLATAVTFAREPRNQYDPQALRAEVRGRQVGYLRRHLAAQFAPVLDDAAVSAFDVCGLIRGGSTRAPSLGVHVWLDRTLTPGLHLEVPSR